MLSLSQWVPVSLLWDSGWEAAGGGNCGPHQQEFNPFLLSSLWGAMLVAHKTGSLLQPPAHPAQHEVRVEDGPSQAQPTMTISRSQSPLPPVDWKTYTSSGRKLRAPAALSPRPCSEDRAGPGVLRETAPLLRYWGGTGQGPFPDLESTSPEATPTQDKGSRSPSTAPSPLAFTTKKKHPVPLGSSSYVIHCPISHMRRLRPIKGRDLHKACLSISWYSRNEDPLHPRQLTYSHGI